MLCEGSRAPAPSHWSCHSPSHASAGLLPPDGATATLTLPLGRRPLASDPQAGAYFLPPPARLTITCVTEHRSHGRPQRWNGAGPATCSWARATCVNGAPDSPVLIGQAREIVKGRSRLAGSHAQTSHPCPLPAKAKASERSEHTSRTRPSALQTLCHASVHSVAPHSTSAPAPRIGP